MRPHTSSKSRLNHILDVLASRVGIISVVGLLIGVGLGVGIYIQSVVTQIDQNHTVFKDAQLRNGYVAMSDINRLILIAQDAAIADEMSPKLVGDFINATDILWVRTDNFTMVRDRGEHFASGDASIAALQRIVSIADSAIQSDFANPRLLVSNLLIAAEDARQHLVLFLDEIRRQGDLVLDQQSSVVRRQQIIMLTSLAGLTIIGSVALSLLRREVLARRAREDAEQRVAFLAYFDPLTELPNRVQFQERLQLMLDTKKPIALLSIDLDEFKMVNDTYGHAAGDAVLCRVATIIAGLAEKNNGVAARLAGDEFAFALPSNHIGALSKLCDQMISDVGEQFIYEGQTLEIGLSIGLAVSTQLNDRMAVSVEMLSRVTDFALYASKSSGRNKFTIYDHELERLFIERRSMVEDLPKAIEACALEVYLQPKVKLPERQIYGFEGLVRWPRDNRIVPPGDFIAIAEESGFVVDIDRFVLNRAAEMIQTWNDMHATEYAISVNLSAIHFGSQRIVTWVEEALSSSRLPAHLLTLEITETVEMRDWKQAGKIIDALRNLGCKIAIDDFGAGFSSLAYLLTTHADELKIDKSLLDRVEVSAEARLLLASVFDIARNLDLDVTVEGVETEAQFKIISNMGAPHGQGYLFGRPLPPREALMSAMESQNNQTLGKSA